MTIPAAVAIHANRLVTDSLPVLSEGARYTLELMSAGKVVRATLIRIAEDMPLGRGFSFQIGNRRLFVYERDLLPGPAGSLIATV